MIIAKQYSHQGASEFLEGTKEWEEITTSLDQVMLKKHKTKISQEQQREGEVLISPSSLNRAVSAQLNTRGWEKKRRNFWIPEDVEVLKESFYIEEEKQKEIAGDNNTHSFMEMDFWKNNVGMEVQFGKYAFILHDFVKMKVFYDLGILDCGIELVPSKNMKKEMSSGPCYFEQAQLYLMPLLEYLDFPVLLIGVE